MISRFLKLMPLVLLLAACGGSGGRPPPAGMEGGSRTASSLILVSDVASIPADGSSVATITAIARDASNRLLPDVQVQFAATSGGIAGAPVLSDSIGEAKVTLSTAGDPTPRTITVTGTAVANGLTHSVAVSVQ